MTTHRSCARCKTRRMLRLYFASTLGSSREAGDSLLCFLHAALPCSALRSAQPNPKPILTACGPGSVGANRMQFLLESLSDLDAGLGKLDSRLLVLQGNPVDELPRVFKAWGIKRLGTQRFSIQCLHTHYSLLPREPATLTRHGCLSRCSCCLFLCSCFFIISLRALHGALRAGPGRHNQVDILKIQGITKFTR